MVLEVSDGIRGLDWVGAWWATFGEGTSRASSRAGAVAAEALAYPLIEAVGHRLAPLRRPNFQPSALARSGLYPHTLKRNGALP